MMLVLKILLTAFRMSTFSTSAFPLWGQSCYAMNPFDGVIPSINASDSLTLENCYDTCLAAGNAWFGVYSTFNSHTRFGF